MKKTIIIIVGLLVLFGGYIFLESKKKIALMKEMEASTPNEFSDIIDKAFEDVVIPSGSEASIYQELLSTHRSSQEGIDLQAMADGALKDNQSYFPDDGLRSLQEMLESGGFVGSLPDWNFSYTTQDSSINEESYEITVLVEGVNNEFSGAFGGIKQEKLEKQLAEIHLLAPQVLPEKYILSPGGEYIRVQFELLGDLYVKTDRIYDGLKTVIDITSFIEEEEWEKIEAMYIGWTKDPVLQIKK